jgi:hypothetical protein
MIKLGMGGTMGLRSFIVAASLCGALGLAGPAAASVVFDYSGTCAVRCAGTGTGVLTLTDAYTPGTDITTATFVSFDWTSSDLTFDLTSANSPTFVGGLNADGTLSSASLQIHPTIGLANEFVVIPNQWIAGNNVLANEDIGYTFSFTEVSGAVPEPATWALMLIGIGGIGVSLRIGRKSIAKAAAA